MKVLTWEAIRRERFSITPEGLFDELARTAESLLSRADDDTARREQFLSEAIPGEADGEYIPPTSPMQRDKYGLDLEEFKEKSGHAPQNWHKSVRQASAIIIDDMRARLRRRGHDRCAPIQQRGVANDRDVERLHASFGVPDAAGFHGSVHCMGHVDVAKYASEVHRAIREGLS